MQRGFLGNYFVAKGVMAMTSLLMLFLSLYRRDNAEIRLTDNC